MPILLAEILNKRPGTKARKIYLFGCKFCLVTVFSQTWKEAATLSKLIQINLTLFNVNMFTRRHENHTG